MDRVRFYGFDPPIENMWAASPRHSLLALYDFLAPHFSHLPADRATLEQLCGDDARWTNQAAAMDPSQSIGATADAWHLRALADDLLGFLETQRPGLGAQPDLWEAQLHARTALGLLRYHANLAAASPDRISQMLALRAVMMTDNLLRHCRTRSGARSHAGLRPQFAPATRGQSDPDGHHERRLVARRGTSPERTGHAIRRHCHVQR